MSSNIRELYIQNSLLYNFGRKYVKIYNVNINRQHTFIMVYLNLIHLSLVILVHMKAFRSDFESKILVSRCEKNINSLIIFCHRNISEFHYRPISVENLRNFIYLINIMLTLRYRYISLYIVLVWLTACVWMLIIVK